jgi:serine/threonine-protein kinase
VVGETVSHYRILSEIGAGGMGVVYKAQDLRLGRFVALKFLPPQLIRDDDARRRLFAEARAASVLDHANVCTIYDVEELPDGRAFLAMAFVDGETLTARLARGAIPPNEAARLAWQIARGLERAHHSGIVHRDVKPGNIMITREGEAKILDFGIAKAAGGPDLTRTGTTVGTVAYMSPEHIRGAPGDEQSDVWALGVVLYEMLTGRRLFSESDNFQLLQAIVERPLPPLQVAGASAELTGILAHALERDRSKRYANAGEMAHALEQCLQHTTASTATYGVVPRSRTRTVAIVAAVLVIAGGMVASGHGDRAAPDRRVRSRCPKRSGSPTSIAMAKRSSSPRAPNARFPAIPYSRVCGLASPTRSQSELCRKQPTCPSASSAATARGIRSAGRR